VFVNDEILQENIIFHATSIHPKPNEKTLISVSYDRQFTQYQELVAPSSDVAYCRGNDCFIRIPISENDLRIIEIIDSWPQTLNTLGFEISTGPVVDFRALEHLKATIENPNCVPLLWMHNIKGIDVEWSIKKNGKAKAIEINRESKNLAIPTKNYVVLKRFTSKEQKKRVHAAVLNAEDFSDFEYIGLENHLNYIHKNRSLMSLDEAYGIAALLNTTIIDQYFRALNGNTQVNATDIRSLSLPEYEKIIEIGKLARKKHLDPGFDCDEAISKELKIEKHLVRN
jgi:adenine-specific DNA-methyltransferase